ncbi:PLAC8-domain-containing protein [Lizonia empirigonia]|nr:PLAC8-domain-containing protein [Lizonia empirigonia]
MDPRYNTYPQRLAQQPQPQVAQHQHQRFSWQAPIETDITQPEQRLPQYQESQGQPQQPAANTNVPSQHNRGFSYAPTPIEHNGSAYYTSSSEDPPVPSSPVFTPIDDRPQSRFDMLNTPGRRQSQRAYALQSHPHDEESLLSPSSPEAQTLPFMLVESAHPEPKVPSPIQQSRHTRQMSSLAPLNTTFTQPAMPAIPQSPRSGGEHQTSPGALPYKTPILPISAAPIRKDTPNSSYNSHTRHQPHSVEPYSPHNFSTHNLTTPHAIFSPDAAHGPNGLDFSLHQPGQIRHPNMDDGSSHTWKHSLCACNGDMSTCLTGLFCPCILSGRTAYRLSQKSKKADPTDMLAHSSTNGHCIAMTLACGVGLGWVFPMLQRTRIRHLYKLEGSCGDDLVKGCCCCCCVSVQNEREVRGREESANRWAGPASRDVYTRSGGMQYRPQD